MQRRPDSTVDESGHLLPTTLEGEVVRLEPLAREHVGGLCEVGLEASLWEHTTVLISERSHMEQYVEAALADRDAGHAQPFATVERRSGRVVGTTRFGSIDLPNLKVEIGWTFVGVPWQRTAVNTEAKLLMMTYGFERLGLRRIELKTNETNLPSRRAIERLGAQQEGILRKHMVMPGGGVRNSVYYSVLDEEWPDVKARLESLLRR